jgi:putative multicomponent Na+:H+ antiporter subunit B
MANLATSDSYSDTYIYAITALLPLTASMVVLQKNPYHALVMRGILGAISALTYAMLGAADVAITEALVGTLLAIMLYAVAVRSSLVFRLGILQETSEHLDNPPFELLEKASAFNDLLEGLRLVFAKHYMRVELLSYTDRSQLQQAFLAKEVHGICVSLDPLSRSASNLPIEQHHLKIRLRHIYNILNAELVSPTTRLIDEVSV